MKTSLKPLPQGTKTSPELVKKLIAEVIAKQNAESDNEIPDEEFYDYGELILDSENDDDEEDELHELLCKRRQS